MFTGNPLATAVPAFENVKICKPTGLIFCVQPRFYSGKMRTGQLKLNGSLTLNFWQAGHKKLSPSSVMWRWRGFLVNGEEHEARNTGEIIDAKALQEYDAAESDLIL